MDPLSNLDTSYFQYEASMTPNDVRQENPSAHLTQNYNSSQQPPGADVVGPTTFPFPGQAGPSLQPQGHTNLEEDASQMLTQFSVGFQSDEPERGLYLPSPTSSVSPSPSQMSQVRASPPYNWNPSFPTPDTLGNLYPHHLPTHFRSFSQPSSTSTPNQALRGRHGLVRTDVDAGVPQAGYSRLPSTVMHPTALPTPAATPLYVQAPPALHGALEPAHMEFTRRHSEADAPGVQGTLPWPYTPAHQTGPSMFQPHPERSSFSLTPSSSRGLCTGFTEAVQCPSSGTEAGYLADETSTPSGSQEDCWMSDSGTHSPEPFSFPEPHTSGTPSQTADHPPPHKDIPLASPWSPGSGPPGNGRLFENRKDLRAAKGLKNPKYARTAKKHVGPMDPKAAKRLKTQRKTDEENISTLLDMFVPKGEKVDLKKDRLGTIVRHANMWLETHKSDASRATFLNRHVRTEGESVTLTEGGVFQPQGQIVCSSDDILGFATHLDASDPGFGDTAGSTSSDMQKQNTSLAHCPNQVIQPMY